MTNTVLYLLYKYAGARVFPRVRDSMLGIAQDFWKDGPENPLLKIAFMQKVLMGKAKTPYMNDASSDKTRGVGLEVPMANLGWHALPGEVSEKMWGVECITPGDDVISDMLITPLSLSKDMSILDLSAGLGFRLRRTVEKFGVYITGLEPDPDIAVRGMGLSVKAGKGNRAIIAAYDPENFNHTKTYDAIIARETFYRVIDKDKLFKNIALCAKPKARISFTDYIIDPQNREKSAVKAWMSFEKHAAPLTLAEMTAVCAKVGFNIKVHDDQTNLYRIEVFQGLKRLADFINSGVALDDYTKKEVSRRLQTWQFRLGALSQGMRFYRFLATKD